MASSKRSAEEEHDRPFKPFSIFGALGETVLLIVGEGGKMKSFAVHQKLLCDASPFFEAACKPEWMATNGNIRTITLSEDEPEIIEAMIYWIYHDRLCCSKEKRVEPGNTESEAIDSVWGFLVKVYVLGVKYQMPRLCDHAIDCIIMLAKDQVAAFRLSTFIYENTNLHSSLRSLWVAIALQEMQWTSFTELKDCLRPEFILEFTEELLWFRSRGVDPSFSQAFCDDYHDHEGNKVCNEARKLEWYESS